MMEERRERPIIFKPEMVRAIIDGKKTQTRRVIKPQPDDCDSFTFVNGGFVGKDGVWCPYGQPGDVLWVRETWGYWGSYPDDGWVIYRADADKAGVTWRPSIYMPKKYARVWLEIKHIGVERVQDISEEDAEEEGVDWMTFAHMDSWEGNEPAREAFRELWDAINAKRGFSWASNPWVWVVSFDVVELRTRDMKEME